MQFTYLCIMPENPTDIKRLVVVKIGMLSRKKGNVSFLGYYILVEVSKI